MPKPFRLATLLKLREATRDERRTALAEAFRAEAVLAENIRGVDEELAAMSEDYRRATLPGRIEVDRLLEHQRREALLVGQRKEYERQRELVLAEVERRREALAQADRDVRMLEKLRENQALAEAEIAERASAKQLDEFAIQGHASRKETAWDA